MLSPATSQALLKYNQDYATADYDNFLARYYQSLTPYQSLAGIGQTSANQMAGLSTQTGANMANALMTGAGQAANYNNLAGYYQGAGAINQANAISGALNSGINNYLLASRYGNIGNNNLNNISPYSQMWDMNEIG